MTNNQFLLRYYEILYTHLIKRYYCKEQVRNLPLFIDVMCHLAGAERVPLQSAAMSILAGEVFTRVNKQEFILVLRVGRNMGVRQVAKMTKSSYSTVVRVTQAHDEHRLTTWPKFDLMQTTEIAKVMSFFEQLFEGGFNVELDLRPGTFDGIDEDSI